MMRSSSTHWMKDTATDERSLRARLPPARLPARFVFSRPRRKDMMIVTSTLMPIPV